MPSQMRAAPCCHSIAPISRWASALLSSSSRRSRSRSEARMAVGAASAESTARASHTVVKDASSSRRPSMQRGYHARMRLGTPRLELISLGLAEMDAWIAGDEKRLRELTGVRVPAHGPPLMDEDLGVL